MAVVAVWEKVASRRSNYGADNARQYWRTFVVLVDDPNDGDYTVRTATGVPRIGTAWQIGSESDLGAPAAKITPRQTDKYVWEVTVEYAADPPGSQDPGDLQENPLLRPAEITWDNEPFTEIVEFETDFDRTPVLNSQHRPYDPPIEREGSLLSLTIVRNEAGFDTFDAASALNPPAINKDPFFGAEPFVAKITRYTGDLQYENGVQFYSVTRKFVFNPEKWDKVVLDTGVVAVEDETGTYTDQVLLDGEGKVLDDYTKPVYRTHRIYMPRFFAAWRLP